MKLEDEIRIKSPTIFLFVFLPLLLFAASCSPDQTPTQASQPLSALEEPTQVFAQIDYVVYHSFGELASRADIIVQARLKSTLDIVNLRRDVADPSKPAPGYFGIGQVYELEVERYLMGSGPGNIRYLEYQGSFEANGTPAPDEIERESVAAKGKIYLPLQADRTYLLFLQRGTGGYLLGAYPSETLYSGVGHPWKFNLDNPNCVRMEDILEEMSPYFPVQSLSSILAEIAKPVTSVTLTVPYPEPDQGCLSTPYP